MLSSTRVWLKLGQRGKRTTLKREKRTTLNKDIRDAGEYLRRRMNATVEVVRIPSSNILRRRVLDQFVPTNTGKLQADKIINRLYRAAWDAQDEWFSTASMRELVKGVMKGINRDQLTKEEWEHLVGQIDILSALRMSTARSGFALENMVMQHPTAVTKAYFGNPRSTASLHSQLDTARRSYVTRAIKEAINDNLGAEQVVMAAARAAIEFTLNYFTAPITASNVKPFSRHASTSMDDPQIKGQVEAREQMKQVYKELLGGTLRSPAQTETETDRLTRRWEGPDLNDMASIFKRRSPSPDRLSPASPRQLNRTMGDLLGTEQSGLQLLTESRGRTKSRGRIESNIVTDL